MPVLAQVLVTLSTLVGVVGVTGPALLALALAGCSEENLTQGRADSGISTADGGDTTGLPYLPGMVFRYRATLTQRSSTGTEKNAIYELVYRIQSVSDRRAAGPSSLVVTATGAQTFRQNWDPTGGADSWVALAGPADDTDRVGAANTTVELSAPPARPAFPKRLPLGSLFFLDLRQAEAIRRAFSDANTTARFVDPSQDPRGRWVLVLDGRDPDAQFYAPSQKRVLSLAYDPKGWLVEASETLGDSTLPNTPTGSFQLSLTRSP